MATYVDRSSLGRRTTTRSASSGEEKALADVDIQSNDQGGSFVLNMFGDNDSDRELSQHGALKFFHKSPVLFIAASPIMRAVGEVNYGWEDDTDPGEFDLTRPNRWHQSAEHFGLCAAYLLMAGEYVAIKNDTARGVELWPIPPDDVEEPETPGGKWQLEDGAVGGLTRTEFDRDELLIIHEPSLLDPYMHGRGPAQVIGHDIDIDTAAANHTAAFLENHAKPDGIVSVPDGMSDDEFKRLRNSLRQKHGGPRNTGKIEVLGSDISFESIMQSFDDLGLSELRQQAAEFARHVFGVPPSIIGDVSDTNRATAETEEYLFKKNRVKPLVDKIVEAHNAQLVRPELGEQYAITTNQIVPKDRRFQLETLMEMPQAFTVNEARELAGKDPFDDERGEQTLLEAEVDAMPQPAPSGEREADVDPLKKTVRVVEKQPDDERIQEVLDAVGAEDMSELREKFGEAMAAEARQTVDQLQDEDFEDVFGGGVLTEAVEAKVDERMEWVLPEIADHTRSELRGTMVEALDEGRNPLDIAREMGDDFDQFSDVRSRRIARTEMLSASNAGTHAAHKNSSVVKLRSWLSTRDGRVRDAHVVLDNKTADNPVPVGTPFIFEGDAAMHPGDFSRAELSINCRCTTVAEFPDRADRDPAEREKIWTQFDKRLSDREQETRDVVVEAFKDQRQRVLARFAEQFDVELQEVA